MIDMPRPRASLLCILPLLLGACATGTTGVPMDAPRGVSVVEGDFVQDDPVAEAGAIVFRTGSQPAEAPVAPPSGEVSRVTFTLGPPADAGLWASSGIFPSVRTAIVRDPDTGAEIVLEMRPTAGVDQLSLEAYQALGLSPADIVTLDVVATDT